MSRPCEVCGSTWATIGGLCETHFMEEVREVREEEMGKKLKEMSDGDLEVRREAISRTYQSVGEDLLVVTQEISDRKVRKMNEEQTQDGEEMRRELLDELENIYHQDRYMRGMARHPVSESYRILSKHLETVQLP